MVAPVSAKRQCVHYYANQIYKLYNNLQHPFDVSEDYKKQIQYDLELPYSDPLRKNLIEMTYC